VELVHRGKVRDVYADGPDELILAASDRVSVYDVVLPTPIPDKGRLLTALSLWWFEQLADVVPNHVISADDVPPEFAGRAIRCRRLSMVPVECVARGYLAGSGWSAYTATGSVCGIVLPPGMAEGARLLEPIFTPTTKTPPEEGHDEPLTFAEVSALMGNVRADELRATTLRLYDAATKITTDRGLLLADTKFEFGVGPDGGLVLADEALTSDSSRYWRVEDWAPGRRQHGYDKQYLRDWAADLGTWDKRPPGPEVPAPVVEETRHRYVALYEQVTGTRWR